MDNRPCIRSELIPRLLASPRERLSSCLALRIPGFLAVRTAQSFGAKLIGFALSAPISFNGLLMYLPMLLIVSRIDFQRVVLYD